MLPIDILTNASPAKTNSRSISASEDQVDGEDLEGLFEAAFKEASDGQANVFVAGQGSPDIKVARLPYVVEVTGALDGEVEGSQNSQADAVEKVILYEGGLSTGFADQKAKVPEMSLGRPETSAASVAAIQIAFSKAGPLINEQTAPSNTGPYELRGSIAPKSDQMPVPATGIATIRQSTGLDDVGSLPTLKPAQVTQTQVAGTATAVALSPATKPPERPIEAWVATSEVSTTRSAETVAVGVVPDRSVRPVASVEVSSRDDRSQQATANLLPTTAPGPDAAQNKTRIMNAESLVRVDAPVGMTGQAAQLEIVEAGLAPDTQIRSAATTPTGSLTAPQTPSPVPVSQQIALQISIQAGQGKSGEIELRLEPEELGKVRITILPREMGLTVSIIAERPETLDLLRRNADQLMTDLGGMDLGGTNLEFSGGETRSAEEQHSIEAEAAENQTQTVLLTPAATQTGRLDIRL